MANINVGTILKVDVGEWQRADEFLCYPITRTWQWTRDNVDIPGAVSGTYTASNSDIGKTIRFRETTSFLGENNNGSTVESSSPSSNSVSDGHFVSGSAIPTLVFQENLTYLGAINTSAVTQRGGLGITFNPSGTGTQKTFIAGGQGNQLTQGREFTLPSPSLVTDFSSLPTATAVTPLNTDITDGGWAKTFSPNCQIPEMRGKHHIPGTTKMLLSGDIRYQNEPAFAVYWRRPWNLPTTGQVEGPVAMYDTNFAPRANTGWICNIPSTLVDGINYQTSLGAEIMSGLSGLSIINNSASAGPSISCFSMSAFDEALARSFTGIATSYTNSTVVLGTEATGKDIRVGDWIVCLKIGNAQRITGWNAGSRTVTITGAGEQQWRVANGTVSDISGAGPWTFTLTTSGSNPFDVRVGSTITATAGTGNIGSGTVTVTAASGNIYTCTATGGAAPVAGAVTFVRQPGDLTYAIVPRGDTKQLSYRPYTAPLDDSIDGYTPIGNNPAINGAVIPNGTKSLLMFGANADGKYSYGSPGDYDDGNTLKIWDPENGAKGGHAYPTFGKIWAYNLDELVKVKNGTDGYTALNVKPYGVWNLPKAALTTMRYIRVTGITYDSSTRRIYISGDYPEQDANSGGPGPYDPSVIHVFEVTNAVAV
jgi:hypothetical protein